MKKLLIICLVALSGAMAQAENTTIASANRTITDSTKTTSGTIASGARAVEFVFSTDFAGTINGVTWSGATDASKGYKAPLGDRLPAITYTISAGNARITEVR